MLNCDTDYQRNNFLISKERITRQVIAGCWLSVFFGGSILEKMGFSQADHLRPKSFSFEARNCFKKKTKCKVDLHNINNLQQNY